MNPYAPENEPHMQSLTDIFGNKRFAQKYTAQGRLFTSERTEIMRDFLTKLNASRKAAGFSPLTASRLAKIFEGLKEEDLYYLDSVCRQARDYSKMFWFKMRNRTKDTHKE